jgi:hypothetical protein
MKKEKKNKPKKESDQSLVDEGNITTIIDKAKESTT